MLHLLALESSCDETACAIINSNNRILGSQVASQIAIHRHYGGVVPELASRNHLAIIKLLLEKTLSQASLSLSQIDGFAATSGPGLSSSLLIGQSTAKALSAAYQRPFLSINHLEGHLLSAFLSHQIKPKNHIGLIVSGGHTLLVHAKDISDYILLGKTLDDAAGEAFDKVARMLKLPYPGGPEIERLAINGDPNRYSFPQALTNQQNFDFSFSGLKTSVLYLLQKIQSEKTKLSKQTLSDLCASFQSSIINVLVDKTIQASLELKCPTISLSGGVASNKTLQQALKKSCEMHQIECLFASSHLNTDNAEMISYVGMLKLLKKEYTSLNQGINPNWSLTTEV